MTTPLPPGLQLPTMAQVAGGALVCLCISLILFGISVAQVYTYAMNCQNDSRLLKSLVAFFLFFEMAHTAFSIHMLYAYMIIDFGNIIAVGGIVWSAGAAAISTMLLVFLLRSFYTWKIWCLSGHNYVLTGVMMILAFSNISLGLTACAFTYTNATWLGYYNNRRSFIVYTTALSFGATCDIVTAVVLMYYLYIRKTGFKGSNYVIHVVMAYSVNSGTLTAITSLIMVFSFVFVHNSLLFAGVFMILGRLYANSVLGSLNARQHLRSKLHKNTGLELTPPIQQRHSMGTQIHVYDISEASAVNSSCTELHDKNPIGLPV